MLAMYFLLAAFHLAAVIVTGILWTYIDVVPKNNLRTHIRDIRAVHFGSIWLASLFFGLGFAFERLGVPAIHWWAFPVGLALLVSFSSIAYMYPKPPDLDPFYYWTRGWPMVWALIGIAGLVVCLSWTVGVLVMYSVKLV